LALLASVQVLIRVVSRAVSNSFRARTGRFRSWPNEALLIDEPLAGDAVVHVDPERIQIVLSNLVENALRHTPSGGRVRLRASSNDGAVRFEVVDDGPGISEADRPHVFEKFYRGSAGGGAGLGLSIARDIVRAHGGEMGLESRLGQGACFWFTLPQKSQSS